MEDKTKEFKEIIEKGTIEQIQEFVLRSFHQIKHTESFSMMIYRLKDEQWLRKEAIKAIEELQGKLYTLKDLLNKKIV